MLFEVPGTTGEISTVNISPISQTATIAGIFRRAFCHQTSTSTPLPSYEHYIITDQNVSYAPCQPAVMSAIVMSVLKLNRRHRLWSQPGTLSRCRPSDDIRLTFDPKSTNWRICVTVLVHSSADVDADTNSNSHRSTDDEQPNHDLDQDFLTWCKCRKPSTPSLFGLGHALFLSLPEGQWIPGHCILSVCFLLCDRGREVERAGFEIADCHANRILRFGDIERGSRGVVLVEVKWGGEFGIGAWIKL